MGPMAPGRLTKVTIAALALVLAACDAFAPVPTTTWAPTVGTLMPGAVLKYKLLDEFGPIAWCDPDFYPVAQRDEQDLAAERLPEIQADSETYGAITNRLGVDWTALPTPEETLAIYREWKLLNAVDLGPADGPLLAFDLITEANPGLGQGVRTQGTIGVLSGDIQVSSQADTALAGCPICLAQDTLIDTPNGPVAIQNLSVGELVWTQDRAGGRMPVRLLRTGSANVPSNHRVVHLVLAEGRELWVSPGHPLADGRAVGELRPSDAVDGLTVLRAELVEYPYDRTFDILPAGSTGLYWADGILLASTIH